MIDKKYVGFCLNTIIKLSAYILICIGILIISARLPQNSVSMLFPSAAAAIVTAFFLAVIEKGKRSFFAKGYMTANIVVGGFFGFLAMAASLGAEILLGSIRINAIVTDFDVKEPFYSVFGYSLFAGIVIFGYLFHIIHKDFGYITAIILGAVLYLVYAACFHSSTFSVFVLSAFDFADPSDYVPVVNMLLIGIIAGLFIIYLGDMRSAAAFLCLFRLTEGFADRMFSVEYNSIFYISLSSAMYSSIILTVVLLAMTAWLIYRINRTDK